MDTASFLEQRGLVAISGGGSGGSNSGEVRKKKVKLSIHPDDVKAGVQDVIMLKNALERETAKLR